MFEVARKPGEIKTTNRLLNGVIRQSCRMDLKSSFRTMPQVDFPLKVQSEGKQDCVCASSSVLLKPRS